MRDVRVVTIYGAVRTCRCGPCKACAPAYEQMAGRMTSAKVQFARVDVDQLQVVS